MCSQYGDQFFQGSKTLALALRAMDGIDDLESI